MTVALRKHDLWFGDGPAPLSAPVDDILANIRANVARSLPGIQLPSVVICGPGPSLKGAMPLIRERKARGDHVWALKATWAALMAEGIEPDAAVMLDASPKQIAYIDGAPVRMRWYLASQVAAPIFEALAGRDVVMWHAPHRNADSLFPRNEIMIGGGPTVASRAIALAHFLRHRTVTLAGVDCGWRVNEPSHTYELADGLAEERSFFAAGEEFRCTVKMSREAKMISRMANHPAYPPVTVLGFSHLAVVAAAFAAWSGDKPSPGSFATSIKPFELGMGAMTGQDFVKVED